MKNICHGGACGKTADARLAAGARKGLSGDTEVLRAHERVGARARESVCVCVCVKEFVHVRVRVCARARVCVRACARFAPHPHGRGNVVDVDLCGQPHSD
jgi:hypothetical protein